MAAAVAFDNVTDVLCAIHLLKEIIRIYSDAMQRTLLTTDPDDFCVPLSYIGKAGISKRLLVALKLVRLCSRRFPRSSNAGADSIPSQAKPLLHTRFLDDEYTTCPARPASLHSPPKRSFFARTRPAGMYNHSSEQPDEVSIR